MLPGSAKESFQIPGEVLRLSRRTGVADIAIRPDGGERRALRVIKPMQCQIRIDEMRCLVPPDVTSISLITPEYFSRTRESDQRETPGHRPKAAAKSTRWCTRLAQELKQTHGSLPRRIEERAHRGPLTGMRTSVAARRGPRRPGFAIVL